MRLSLRNRQIDESLLLAYLITLVIGLVMVYSTSSIMAESRFGSHLFFFKKQLMWAVLSIIAVAVICRINLERMAVYSAPALLLVILLLSLVFLMPARNGSHRWLIMGPLTMQPSELFRFILIIYLAFSLANPRRNISDLKQLLFPYVPIIGVGMLLILLEPDLGVVIVTSATVLGILFLAGARLKHLAVALLPMMAAGSLVVFVFGYKKARIMDYFGAVMDPLQGSYQVKQAALTLGSGGLLGTGLGEGRQKLFFLPYPHTDFIFAAIGEELGLLGLLVILGLLFYMMWRGFKIASNQPDKFGFLLASGMTLSLFINIAINLGVVTAMLPVTGLPLPFLSSGGSSLLVSSASIAVLLNLSRRTVAA